MEFALLAALNADRATRRAVIVVSDPETGAARLVHPGDDLAADPYAEEIGRRFRSGQSGLVTGSDGRAAFLAVHLPPPRLVVIGAVHISQALAPMARIAGFDLTLIDPRTAFATPERFPDVTLIADWPDVALPEVGLDPWTALAALTHDPKIDEPALTAALAAGCFYVGALGSRKTHARRVERLTALGLAPEVIARIRAPIGLAIGAASPAEIAVSVLAEIIGALRGAGADPARP